MAKRILYILLGAIVVFGLLFLAWSWLFNRPASTQTTGTFGTASSTNQSGQNGSGINGNGETGLNGPGGATSGNLSSTNDVTPLGGTGSNTSTTNTSTTGSGSNGAGGNTTTSGGTSGSSGTGSLASGGTLGSGSTGSSGSSGGSTAGNGSTNNGGTSSGGTGTGGTNGTGGTLGGSGTTGSTGTGGTTGSGTTGTGGTSGTGGTTGGVAGVTWLGGGAPFNATPVNQVNSGAGGGVPYISTPVSSSGGTTLIEALAATAIAGSLTCALQSGILAIWSGGTTGGLTVGAAAAATGYAQTQSGLITSLPVPTIFGGTGFASDAVTHLQIAGLGSITGASYTLQATQSAANTAKAGQNFATCLINVIAKVALQQLTISTVNWINSGFNGQPAFVNNFDQFFTNVADASAGAFIQGSGLAFLCSPFQLQIKIAIAQAYANRSAQSCTLTGIIKDVNGFMNGQFAQGGWPGFISFTSVPTNNPYGAFAYAQVGLANAQATAANNAKNNISPTGFLNLQQVTCSVNTQLNGISGTAAIGTNPQAAIAAGKAALPSDCTTKIVTPGSVIANNLGAVNKSGVDTLGLTNDIDQIITALTTQLITKELQNGLTSLSQTTTQTPADIAAENQAQSLLSSMQNNTSLAQELGSVFQGSISDVQDTQSQLNDEANCWNAVASSTSSGASQAATNAASAQAEIAALQPQVDGFNNNITSVNNAIATINQLEYNLTIAASDADVANVQSSYDAASASFPSQNDITTAQQNRTTLQSQLSTIDQTSAANLQQCEAITQ